MANRRKKSDAWIRILLGLAGAVVALIPTWLYLGARLALSPNGFFQEIILLGAGLWFLGMIQFFLLIVLVFWIVTVCFD